MSERKGSVPGGLALVYCIVLTVWLFMNGYALQWLIGVPLGAGAYLVVRRVRNSMGREK